MSQAGALAARAAVAHTVGVRNITGPARECVNEADCEAGFTEGPAGTQSEVSIAVDSTGQNIVIGFNDFRGFSSNPLSISGYMYSSDGGQTFVDGGQLPSAPDHFVFGDPDVKYLGGCSFVYSSILLKPYTPSPTHLVQTIGVHRSTDCGHTWAGPFEVPAASNPNGNVDVNGDPVDAADKEYMDVDPETGRVLLSWSNFVDGTGVEISATYSDNVASGAPPTWSARKVVAATDADGQGSIPRFAGNGSPNAYMAWSRFPFPGTFFGYGNNVGFARSTDNGATWSAPRDLTSEFFTMDHVLGDDRVNTNPSLAVDKTGGRFRGNVYVVYANDNSGDGADIAFQRSTDDGLTFSAPIALNSRPGSDRAQWFPWVTVDRDTGRVYVFYYDQGIADSGHRSETTYTFSDDAGAHWSPPAPLTSRPFKAGWGNDTSQPNLGDYNQAVAQAGDLFAAYALASRPPAGFADGQPSTSMTVPDVVFNRVASARDDHEFEGEEHGGDDRRAAPVDLQSVTFKDSSGNGNIDPGEEVALKIELRNYVTNLLSARRLRELTARLSTTTPGVSVLRGQSPYPGLNPGQSATNKKDFVLKTAPGFVPGTPIELTLRVRSEEDQSATLLHTQFTGTPSASTLLTENFDGVASGTLPAGWTAAHGAGANVVRWTTKNTFCGGSNAAFHQNANDGPGTGGSRQTRWERLFSPAFAVPVTSEYVTIDFDVCYNTEDDPNFNILAYDGFFLRVTDLTPGRTLRSVLAEAFEDEFNTGALQHYPKHFPRNSNPAYFQDMSAWAGDSGGVKHVRMRLPGMAGSTVQLRFEFTQDGAATCADVRPGASCGVAFDNLVVKSVVSVRP